MQSALLIVVALSQAACARDLPPALGDPVPDAWFTVVDPTGTDWEVGDSLQLSELGGKPVILDYWASWCLPCKDQHEYVMGLENTYKDRVNFLGVLFEDTDANALAWLEEQGAAYPTVRELDGTIAEEFWITGLPHFVMLTPDRRLSWDMIGGGAWFADSVTVRLIEMLGGVHSAAQR